MNARPSPDVLVAHLSGEAVLLNLATKDYHRLNETGAFIWQRLETGATAAEVVTALREAFLVDAAEADRKVNVFFEELARRKLIQEEHSTAG